MTIDDLLDELAAFLARFDQAKARLHDAGRTEPELLYRPATGDAARELLDLERWLWSLKRRARSL